MLRFGIVSEVNLKSVQVRVHFGDDDSTSFWLPVLQTKTLKDKFYAMPDVGEQVACLMDENSEDGVILGSIYSSADLPPVGSENEISMNLENGSFINSNKETQTLTISFPNLKIIGNIQHEGILQNTGGISSNGDIADKKSTMQSIRDVYNPHTHIGNMGSPTSKPDGAM